MGEYESLAEFVLRYVGFGLGLGVFTMLFGFLASFWRVLD